MPTPRDDESRDEFIERCIPVVIDDGTAEDGAQAYAVCSSMWEQAHEEGKMIRKTLNIEVKEKTENGGRIIINTADVDRDSDRVMPTGAQISNYMKNPVVQYGHNYHEPWATVGRTTSLEMNDAGIVAEFELRPAANEQDPQNIVRLLWEGDWIRTASIGFEPKAREENDHGGYDFTEWDLLEWSLVPVPANQNALRLAAKALDDEPAYQEQPEPESAEIEEEIPESKATVPYKGHPPAAEGRAWDAGAARSRLRAWAGGDEWTAAKYRQGFVFVDGDPDLLGSYKGPHHDVVDGRIVTVWRGVMAAMGSLVFGARSGRIADEGDRRAVYGHLKKHYAQFDKEAPEFREYDEAELKELFPELEDETEPIIDAPADVEDADDTEPILTPEVLTSLAEYLTELAELLT